MKRALVYGANGALGRALVAALRGVEQWEVIGCDVSMSSHAHHNIHIVRGGMALQAEEVRTGLSRAIGDNWLDAIFCVSGGFIASAPSNDHFLQVADRMITSSICPSLVSTRLSVQFLKPKGLLTLPGAHIVTQRQPSAAMSSYGASKSFVHYLTRSVAQADSGMPPGSKVISISPIFIDTPMNRSLRPNAERSSWTPLTRISDKLIEWASSPENVTNGDIITIKTEQNVTSFISADGSSK